MGYKHPFNDGNGRMGRLWQTLILSKWKILLAYLPAETLVRHRQETYYASLGKADQEGSSTVFVEFMLEALHDALLALLQQQGQEGTDQVTENVSEQVARLISLLAGHEMSTAELMQSLSLKHAPTFRKNYLTPALDSSLIERTQPDAPRGPTQKYRFTEKGRSIL